jgi:hypothetical protein
MIERKRQKARPMSETSRTIVAACNVPNGMTAPELAAATGCTPKTINRRVCNLITWGHLFKAGALMKYRYFTTLDAAQQWDLDNTDAIEAAIEWSAKTPNERKRLRAARDKQKATRKVRAARLRVVAEKESVPAPVTVKSTSSARPARMPGEPVITPQTKITVAPAGLDYRYAVDPSIAGRGVISQDYFERRRGGA